MIGLDKIINVHFYAVKHDLEFSEIEGQIYSDTYLMGIRQTYGSRESHRGTIHIYRYELYDHKGNQMHKICEGNWCLDYLANYGSIHFRVVDPLGRVQNHTFGPGVPGIIKAIKFLREIAQYQSLEHFNLTTENKSLKETLELLTSENTELKSLLNQGNG